MTNQVCAWLVILVIKVLFTPMSYKCYITVSSIRTHGNIKRLSMKNMILIYKGK